MTAQVSDHPIKGLARARRCPTLIERRYEVLSYEAVERLFRSAEVLSEGQVQTSTSGAASWFGSTMITLDLMAVADAADDASVGPGASMQARVAHVAAGSVRVRLRASRLARAEVARRLPDRELGTASVETRVRLAGGHLHIDVDLEVPLGVSSRRRTR